VHTCVDVEKRLNKCDHWCTHVSMSRWFDGKVVRTPCAPTGTKTTSTHLPLGAHKCERGMAHEAIRSAQQPEMTNLVPIKCLMSASICASSCKSIGTEIQEMTSSMVSKRDIGIKTKQWNPGHRNLWVAAGKSQCECARKAPITLMMRMEHGVGLRTCETHGRLLLTTFASAARC
jgi:hypothetical protein